MTVHKTAMEAVAQSEQLDAPLSTLESALENEMDEEVRGQILTWILHWT